MSAFLHAMFYATIVLLSLLGLACALFLFICGFAAWADVKAEQAGLYDE